ncbi:GntR family transcriptional regulator [Planctomycetota bacterium]|nr:GntR family transcriptional regulator [Planctomycetota bacterium]
MNTPSANIKNWLITSIRNGKFPPGTPLPTRHQLMAQFNVARATADRAINDLINESWAYSRKGSGTFASIPEEAEPRLYFVDASLPFAQRVASGLNGKIPYEMLSISEVNAQLPRISRPGSRVVWYLPHQYSYYFISILANASVPQMLINRHIKRCSYVMTDTINCINNAVKSIHTQHPDLNWGLLLPPFNTDYYYWYEREIAIYQALANLNIVPSVSIRSEGITPHSYWQASARMLDRINKPQIIFCPEIHLATQLYSLAYERDIKLGDQLFMLLTDYEENLQPSHGLYMLENDWDAMADVTAKWALTQEPKLEQHYINSQLHSGEPLLV